MSDCAHERRPRRAKRVADANLPLPGRGTHEQKIRDIGARDQQDDADGSQQDHERRSERPNELFAKRDHAHGPPGIRPREFARNVGGDPRKISLRVGRRQIRLQTADKREALAASIPALFRRQHVQGPDDRTQRKPESLWQLTGGWKSEPFGKHANNRGRLAVERDDAPADSRIPAEAAPPQAVRDQDDASARSRLRARNVRPTIGWTPRTVEKLGADADCTDPFGLAAPGQVDLFGSHRRKMIEGGVAVQVVDEVSRRRRQTIEPESLLDVQAEFPGHHDAIRVGIRKRPKEHGVEDAKDGGIGAETQCQRQNGERGEAGPSRTALEMRT